MKTKLHSLFIGLALIADIHQATAQVTNLGIAPAPGGQSFLYWPGSGMNYVLQTTANLATPNWVTASNAVTVNAVTVTNSAPAGFFRLLPTTNTTAGMALIPAGSFLMGNYLFFNTATGDSDITDASPTNVYVSAFYMDVNLVSYGLWTNVYAYATNHGYRFVHPGSAQNAAASQPVWAVDWFDCVKWCNARSQQAGLTPVYYTDAGFSQLFTNAEYDANFNYTTVYQNLAADGYRLPTEAEWEKAARGGLVGHRFPWGNSISPSQANYSVAPGSFSYDLGSSGYGMTTPVGSFAPNGYGLYDMAGNVSQYCWDWYQFVATPYGQPTTNNPTGPTTQPPSSTRVVRGGGYEWTARYARCASRYFSEPDYFAGFHFGFRCVKGH